MRHLIPVLLSLLPLCVLSADSTLNHPPATQQDYTLSNQWEHAEVRLGLLEKMQNPSTFTLLEKIGIKPGMNCLDIGSGLGGVAKWMAERVGDTGQVYATDINTHLLERIRSDNLLVLQEDFSASKISLPANHFDLIHTRNVLMHLQNKEELIIRMVSLLKPGGVLVVEDMGVFAGDYRLSDLDAPQAAWKKEAHDYQLVEEKGKISFSSGFLNHRWFRRAGLINITGQIHGDLVQGNSTAGQFMYYSTLQIEPEQNIRQEDNLPYQQILKAYLSPKSYWWDHLRIITVGYKPDLEKPEFSSNF